MECHVGQRRHERWKSLNYQVACRVDSCERLARREIEVLVDLRARTVHAQHDLKGSVARGPVTVLLGERHCSGGARDIVLICEVCINQRLGLEQHLRGVILLEAVNEEIDVEAVISKAGDAAKNRATSGRDACAVTFEDRKDGQRQLGFELVTRFVIENLELSPGHVVGDQVWQTLEEPKVGPLVQRLVAYILHKLRAGVRRVRQRDCVSLHARSSIIHQWRLSPHVVSDANERVVRLFWRRAEHKRLLVLAIAPHVWR